MTRKITNSDFLAWIRLCNHLTVGAVEFDAEGKPFFLVDDPENKWPSLIGLFLDSDFFKFVLWRDRLAATIEAECAIRENLIARPVATQIVQ